MRGCSVAPEEDSLVWLGDRDRVSFYCTVPADMPNSRLHATLRVTIQGAEGDTEFKVIFELPLTLSTDADYQPVKLVANWKRKLADRGFEHKAGAKGERRRRRSHWRLPEVLDNFMPLAQMPAISTLTQLVTESEARVAEAYRLREHPDADKDDSLDIDLCEAVLAIDVANLQNFLLKMSQQILQSPDAMEHIHEVVQASVDLFEDCYRAAWEWIAYTDVQGVQDYQKVVLQIKRSIESGQEQEALQPSHNVVELLSSAVQLQGQFVQTIQRLCASTFGEMSEPKSKQDGNPTRVSSRDSAGGDDDKRYGFLLCHTSVLLPDVSR